MVVEPEPCVPSPCGPNAECRIINNRGVCACFPEYHGNPYIECRPECVVSSECVKTKACSNNKCVDPCRNRCGLNANCDVVNHNAICSCIPGYTGDAFVQCIEIKSKWQNFNVHREF